MKRLFSIVALLLLAIWLPATLHCDLEAAGLAPSAVACHDDHCTSEHSADNCSLIEDGSFRASADTLKVASPNLVSFCACLLCGAAISISPPMLAVEPSIAPPLELKVGWQFVVRAAPPARAPSLKTSARA